MPHPFHHPCSCGADVEPLEARQLLSGGPVPAAVVGGRSASLLDTHHAHAHHRRHHHRAASRSPLFRTEQTLAVPVPPAVGAVVSPYLLSGDFNGDGKADLLEVAAGAGDSNSGSYPSRSFFALLPGRGDGTFAVPPASADLVLAGGVTGVVVADFNRDGRCDLLVSTAQGSVLQGTLASQTVEFRGNRDGSFQPGTILPFDASETVLTEGDFNGDGNLDLVTEVDAAAGPAGSPPVPQVRVRLGDGSGNFSSPRPALQTPGVERVAAADFNGDGRADLVVLAADGRGRVLTASPAGGFVDAFDFTFHASGLTLDNVVVANLTGGGVADLVVPSTDGKHAAAVLRGRGDGTFLPPVDVGPATTYGGEPVLSADFVGTGRPDLLVRTLGAGSGEVVLEGNGDGTFGAWAAVAGGGSAGQTAADFGGQGKAALASATPGGTVRLAST